MRKTGIDDVSDQAHGVLEQAASDPAFLIEIKDNNAKLLEALGLSPQQAASVSLPIGNKQVCLSIPSINFHMCMDIGGF